MTDDATAQSPTKTKKKLPFKPTALRKTSLPKLVSGDDDAKAEGDCLDLFRRSKEMESIVAADRERRLRKRQKRDEERTRRSSTTSKRPLQDDDAPQDDPWPQDGDVSPARKRQEQQGVPETVHRDSFRSSRPSSSVRDSPSRQASRELVTPPASKRSRMASTPSRTPILSIDEVMMHSPSTQRLQSRSIHSLETPRKSPPEIARTPGTARVVLLDSDDDDSSALGASPSKRRRGSSVVEVLQEDPAPPPLLDKDDEDDDDGEFGEYVRRAEEQRARDSAMLGGQLGAGVSARETVDILVTSVVPNTGPCRMKFVFDRPLKLVRNSWVALQRKKGVQLPLQRDDDVILTWRRQKVYIFSTLLNLGIRPQGGGRVAVDEPGSDGPARSHTRVHMEAWTPELFHDMERQEELRRRREAGDASEPEDAGPAPTPTPPPEVRLRVILRAPGFEDVKLSVRPETTAETLVTGFRAQRGVGSDRDVGLWFDGERLEEHVTMEDAEIDDMDAFEVHIR